MRNIPRLMLCTGKMNVLSARGGDIKALQARGRHFSIVIALAHEAAVLIRDMSEDLPWACLGS